MKYMPRVVVLLVARALILILKVLEKLERRQGRKLLKKIHKLEAKAAVGEVS